MTETFYLPPLESDAPRTVALRRAVARLTTTQQTEERSRKRYPLKVCKIRTSPSRKPLDNPRSETTSTTMPQNGNHPSLTHDTEPLPSEQEIIQRLEELRLEKKKLIETFNALKKSYLRTPFRETSKESTRSALNTFQSMASTKSCASDEESNNSKSTANRFVCDGRSTPATLSPCKNDPTDLHFEHHPKRKHEQHHDYHYDTHQRRPTKRAPISHLHPYPYRKEQRSTRCEKFSTNDTHREEMQKTRNGPIQPPLHHRTDNEDHRRFFHPSRYSVSPHRVEFSQRRYPSRSPEFSQRRYHSRSPEFSQRRYSRSPRPGPIIKRRRISPSPPPLPRPSSLHPRALLKRSHIPLSRRPESPVYSSYVPRMRRSSVHQEEHWKNPPPPPPPSRRRTRTPPFSTRTSHYDHHKPNLNRPLANIPSPPTPRPSFTTLLRPIENKHHRETILNERRETTLNEDRSIKHHRETTLYEERTFQRRQSISTGGGGGGGYSCDKRRH